MAGVNAQRTAPVVQTVEELDDLLTIPSDALITDLASLDGDIMVVGSAGKMGPSLAMLGQRALQEVGGGRKVIAVSRFSDASARDKLNNSGVETIAADLSDPNALASLPDVPNIIYMLGTKFGTTGREYQTWSTNVYLAGRVVDRFRESRFTVFSSGNVYPLRPVVLGGADESVAADPVGEYAQSCLGRERVFEHASHTYGTPVAIFRLNYAIDLRYGVLYDIASQVHAGQAVDISMGSVNVIWQGDANAIALRALTLADTPPQVLNVTGPENISVRWLVDQFARRFGVESAITGAEASNALLSNASKSFGHFGYPSMPLSTMLDLVASWITAGGPSLGKPTHFQEREGKF